MKKLTPSDDGDVLIY